MAPLERSRPALREAGPSKLGPYICRVALPMFSPIVVPASRTLVV
jgi:hypothetical protein